MCEPGRVSERPCVLLFGRKKDRRVGVIFRSPVFIRPAMDRYFQGASGGCGRPVHAGMDVFLKMLQIYYKKRLRNFQNWCMIFKVVSQAPVAQLDRARASDARCRKFESCQVHFLFSKINIKEDI